MPRAIWSGSVSFGLVNIPVKLYNAVSRKNVRFNQLERDTGQRIRRKWVAGDDDHEVTSDDLVKGYEYTKGNYVIVDEDELAALDPVSQRTLDLEEFVDLSEIDPLYYDAPYYLVPDKSAKPYRLLVEAMEDAGKVGIATFVMRSKQYLAAIRPVDGKLVLSTMVYPDEVNDIGEIPEVEDLAGVEVSEREVAMARQLIESLSEEFEPAKFKDTHREQVMDLIERKASGEEVVAVEEAPSTSAKVVDLMAALEASVAEAKKARTRHPTARADDAEGDAEDDGDAAGAGGDGEKGSGATVHRVAKAAAKKAPAKKAAAKKATAKKAPARKSA